jgi:hypothetical protein
MKNPGASLLAGIFVGEEIYYTGVLHTQMQRSSKTVLVAAIFPEQAPGYGPCLPIKKRKFDVVISDINIAEINGCSKEKRNKLYKYLSQINYTLINSEKISVRIAEKIIDLNVLKQKSFMEFQAYCEP